MVDTFPCLSVGCLLYQYNQIANKLDYVANLESALKNSGLTDETKEHIRHQITTNLYNKRPVKLDTEEQKSIKDLQDNDEIIILPADKGRMAVIMNKSDYIDKANILLKGLLLKSDTAIQRYSDTGTGTWNQNLEPCIIYAN